MFSPVPIRFAPHSFILSMLAIAFCACGTGSDPSDSTDRNQNGHVPTIALHGRVLDIESCTDQLGCRGVQDVVVALAAAPDAVRSEPTQSDGSFDLKGVPAGSPQDILIIPSDATEATYVSTLNPSVTSRDDADTLYGLELYVLPRGPNTLYDAISSEMGADLAQNGGYVGQVVAPASDGEGLVAASDVRISAYPAPRALRFVNVLPRYQSDTQALLPDTADRTGQFGLFVALGQPGGSDPSVFVPIKEHQTFDLLVAPLLPGIVTFGLHVGR